MSVFALINPSLLVWTRTTSGYNAPAAAEKLKIDPALLEAWERGEAQPTIPQLRRLAELYKRPLAVFYLHEVPTDFGVMHDYRRLQQGVRESSPLLFYEIRRAHQRRLIAIELAEQLGETLPMLELTASASEDIDSLAARIREYLGVTIDEQIHWREKYQALNAWKDAIERVGVLVFQTERIPLSVMRGMSISESPLPIIVLNGTDSPRGKIFTLLHEFVHIVLNSAGLCDLHEAQNVRTTEDELEIYCNAVAAAILLPRQVMLADRLLADSPHVREWSEEEIQELSERYSVSQETILRRLVTLRRASNGFYQQKREEYLQAYAKHREAEKEKGGFAPYNRMVIRRNGTAYTRLVLDAYNEDAISVSDVADYLDTRIRHLADIEDALRSAQGVNE